MTAPSRNGISTGLMDSSAPGRAMVSDGWYNGVAAVAATLAIKANGALSPSMALHSNVADKNQAQRIPEATLTGSRVRGVWIRPKD